MNRNFDRAAEDMGNIVNLGHVNFRIADQRLATAFYVTGLGLTRDPYMMSGTDNMWVNVGASQFHLPTGPALYAPVTLTGLVTPDLDALAERLAMVRGELAGTQFSFSRLDDCIEAVCPWGNRVRLHAPDESRFGLFRQNMGYVEFEIGRGAAAVIGRFYREVMGAGVDLHDGEARVSAGDHQHLVFREMEHPQPPCPEHHVQIYLADFSRPYRWLRERNLIASENNKHQYGFNRIVDVDTGSPVFILDHEVRSMRHPMFGRSLVNRNAGQTIRTYRAGQDALAWRKG